MPAKAGFYEEKKKKNIWEGFLKFQTLVSTRLEKTNTVLVQKLEQTFILGL